MQWCRPDVSERCTGTDDNITASIQSDVNTGGMLVIRKGRYPIDISDSIICGDGPQEYIPNDTFASDEKIFTVISGINGTITHCDPEKCLNFILLMAICFVIPGSGKSTYLKQIAIITILAHCGSYVPAESAKIPIRDRVCCRIGNSDDQEHNISTFLLEMKETAFICNNTTDRSLVLIDELGRATSNEDGVAISWSVSEYLLKKRAMTFFVTHYPQLASLAAIYPIVQNIHLQASVSNSGNGGEISYTHKAVAGPCSVSTDYGVKLALKCGWPIEVVGNADRIQEVVIGLLPDEGLCHSRPIQQLSDTRTKAYSILGRISRELQGLISDGKVSSISSIRSNLIRIQERYTQSIDSDLHVAMNQLLRRDSPTQRFFSETRASSRNIAKNITHRDTMSNIFVTEDTLFDLDESGCGHCSEDRSSSSDSGSSISSDSSALLS
jgi:MutS domain V